MLIPEMQLSEWRKLKAGEIKGLKSCAVVADGALLFFAIIPPVEAGVTIVDRISTQAEYLAAQGNSVGGRELESSLEQGEQRWQ